MANSLIVWSAQEKICEKIFLQILRQKNRRRKITRTFQSAKIERNNFTSAKFRQNLINLLK